MVDLVDEVRKLHEKMDELSPPVRAEVNLLYIYLEERSNQHPISDIVEAVIFVSDVLTQQLNAKQEKSEAMRHGWD